jgi:GH24 family phage-related lysozyme (muramidase)
MINGRVLVAGLTLSMAAFVGIAVNEGYVDQAMIPTKNDVPTVGIGSTSYEDGRKVQLGDRITPVRAIVLASNHISKEEQVFRASLPGVKLYQEEYDLYMDWVYQYGTGRWNKSSMRRELLSGNYKAACDALLLYKFAGGFDCSTPGNKVCAGVWTRQLERHKTCMSLQ